MRPFLVLGGALALAASCSLTAEVDDLASAGGAGGTSADASAAGGASASAGAAATGGTSGASGTSGTSGLGGAGGASAAGGASGAGGDAGAGATDASGRTGGAGTGGTGAVDAGPGCGDLQRNGTETDVDCGGGACPACPPGATCVAPSDCTLGSCVADRCQKAECTDATRNGDETDEDCGGPDCPPCAPGRTCGWAGDCSSGVCTATVCQAPTCTDFVRNGDETDADCGGMLCPLCLPTKRCARDEDCTTSYCAGNVCTDPACGDTVKNGDETDVDCGGTLCLPCGDGKDCRLHPDCASGVCVGQQCAVPACDDNVKNGTETDVDCGGGCPNPCATGERCALPSDCVGGVCTGGTCFVPEVCLNGLDDDGDGKADCADEECDPGFQCVPAVASGWAGFFSVRKDAFGAPLPAPTDCAAGVAPTRYFSGPRNTGQCAACSCGSLSGATCANTPLLCNFNPGTNGVCAPPTSFTPTSCLTRPYTACPSMSCQLGATAVLTPGTCPASGGGVVASDMWNQVADVCGTSVAPGAGCGAGSVCAPRAAPAYGGPCIQMSGAVTCPAGYATRHVAYTGGTDQRGCTACSCTPNTTCRATTYRIFDGVSCNLGDPNGVLGTTTCSHFGWVADGFCGGTWSVRPEAASAAENTTCSTAGGAPNGQIATTGAVTLCCL